MIIEKPNCPDCGLEAEGTLETIYGIACFSKIPETNEYEYTGSTDVNWDSQRTVDEPAGFVLVCRNGHQWASKIEGHS